MAPSLPMPLAAAGRPGRRSRPPAGSPPRRRQPISPAGRSQLTGYDAAARTPSRLPPGLWRSHDELGAVSRGHVRDRTQITVIRTVAGPLELDPMTALNGGSFARLPPAPTTLCYPRVRRCGYRAPQRRASVAGRPKAGKGRRPQRAISTSAHDPRRTSSRQKRSRSALGRMHSDAAGHPALGQP